MKSKHIILVVSFLFLTIILYQKKSTIVVPDSRFLFIPHFSVYLPTISNQTTNCQKAGMAVASRQAIEPNDWAILCASWGHTWKIAPNNRGLPFEHVNMFWCDDDANWQTLRAYIPKDSTKPLLFLNEPDLADQCNISPQQAIITYQQILNEHPNICLSAPQVSHLDYLNDWQWLSTFFDLVLENQLPMPCFGTLHTYLADPPETLLESYLNLVKTYPGMSQTIWVTEFGRFNYDQVDNMINYYQTHPNVDRFAWYAPRNVTTSLFVGSTYQLTPAGQAWADNFPK